MYKMNQSFLRRLTNHVPVNSRTFLNFKQMYKLSLVQYIVAVLQSKKLSKTRQLINWHLCALLWLWLKWLNSNNSDTQFVARFNLSCNRWQSLEHTSVQLAFVIPESSNLRVPESTKQVYYENLSLYELLNMQKFKNYGWHCINFNSTLPKVYASKIGYVIKANLHLM